MATLSDVAVRIDERDPWDVLRERTAARIALGRTGASLPTAALLAFQLDHARARDAVHRPLDADALATAVEGLGHATVRVDSAAIDRATFLLRPDLGRRLDDGSAARLDARAEAPCDVVFVLADGLSAQAVQRHGVALLAAVVPRLEGLVIGPVAIARQARVALGDAIGAALHARAVVMVIGERPGLTSPDSLGLYLTFDPKPGRHDAERNCLSNVRPEGLTPDAAAQRLDWLIRASLRLSLSGVGLKDDSALLESG